MRRRVIVLPATVAALASCPAAASAGSYRVYSCVAPGGGPAPVADGSYGWQASGRPQAGSLFLTNECPAEHGLAARLDGSNAQPLGAGGQWTFTPAPNTSIAAFDLTPPARQARRASGDRQRTLADVRARTLEPERRLPLPLPLLRLGALRLPRPRALRARVPLRPGLQPPDLGQRRLSAVCPAGWRAGRAGATLPRSTNSRSRPLAL